MVTIITLVILQQVFKTVQPFPADLMQEGYFGIVSPAPNTILLQVSATENHFIQDEAILGWILFHYISYSIRP